MKVPKCISINHEFLEWIERERPKFYKKFSVNVEKLLRVTLMSTSLSAKDYEKKRIAVRLAEINQVNEQFKLEKRSLLAQMNFLEDKKVKK